MTTMKRTLIDKAFTANLNHRDRRLFTIENAETFHEQAIKDTASIIDLLREAERKRIQRAKGFMVF